MRLSRKWSNRTSVLTVSGVIATGAGMVKCAGMGDVYSTAGARMVETARAHGLAFAETIALISNKLEPY